MSNSNPFGNYAGNQRTSGSGERRAAYVGVAPLKVLAINPTREQLREIIGDGADKFNVEYAQRPNYNQVTVRPLAIWVSDYEGKVSPTLLNYDLGLEYVESKSGKGLFFSDDGKTSYAATEAMMPSWTKGPFIKSRIGEAAWYDLVYKLFKWDQNDETPFSKFLKDTGLDLETIYAGNFKGVHDFVEYAKAQDFTVIAPFTVKVDHTENGEVYRQRVLNRPEYIFSNWSGVTDSQIKSLVTREAAQQEQGYQFTNDGYCITKGLVEFNAEEHMKHIPNTGDAISDLLDL